MRASKRDTDVKNSLLDSVGEGEGGMIWETSIETCILSYVKQIASPGWMHETSAQGWCTGMTQRDGMGREGGGKGVQDGEHMDTHGLFMSMYSKNHCMQPRVHFRQFPHWATWGLSSVGRESMKSLSDFT